jgi:hypothetical protein
MIIMVLKGGLGNQMFQYACGRALSLRHNVPLVLNLSVLGIARVARTYALDAFNICNVEFNQESSLVINEKHYHFDPSVLSLRFGKLDGYWQSEKYFKDYESVIRQDFIFKESVEHKEISNNESVAVQVRRGDYITDPGCARVHGNCCPLDYYSRAIDYIKTQVSNPKFFFFSDEPEWFTKKTFPWVDEGVVMPDKHARGMSLLSQCKHQINANSSYGWWGSWLNTNPNKIVCVPEKWFNDNSLNTKDLIPEGWIKI